jgi:D-3-phosphoglycerate dehydrogenase / 2-oxoglutarate reductase
LVPQTLSMRARRWQRLEAHLLGGRTVGIIGLGRIGSRVADLAMAFGARVLAHDPFVDAALAAARGIPLETLDAVLQKSDIVSVHAAKSGPNAMRLSAREFGRMKPGALLVNLARGGMVDEEALHEALMRGHLGGAGLDVFDAEPYQGPLCDLENVILTPHSATMPVETRVAMETEAVDKGLRFLAGELRPGERIL